MKIKISLFAFLIFGLFQAQNDTIIIQAKLSENRRNLEIQQEIIYHNKSSQPIEKIRLLNWIAAYRPRDTDLAYRKLEDRNRDLHFAKPGELGKILSLNLESLDGISAEIFDTNLENLDVQLPEKLPAGKSISLHLDYELQLPDAKFTSYGTSDQSVAVKYFFLVPDSFENQIEGPKKYQDIEETQNYGTHWKVIWDVPTNQFVKSNLPETYPNYFEGKLNNDPEFFISPNQFSKITTTVDGKNTIADFGFHLTPEELQNLEFYLPLHLKYVKEKTGIFPDKIFISEKFRKKEDFFGNDDIKFWKYRFPLFTSSENTDLDYFSIISKKVLEQEIITNTTEDHWIKNGMKSYLEYQYLKDFYADKKLLGQLPETKILGMRPLKIFNAAKLDLTDRYGLAYQYMLMQNLDQKIDEDFPQLSNFNQMAISNFEMGTLFNYVSEEMGSNNFDNFVRNYFQNHQNERINKEDFLEKLAQSNHSSSQFLQNFIDRKHRVNINLQKVKKEGDQLQVKIKKNTEEKIPFHIQTLEKTGDKKSYWFDTNTSTESTLYNIPNSEITKVLVNDGYEFPEKSFRDNYLYTAGLFSNTKKVKFKLIKDIPNPEYSEIYLNPRANFNAYDGILLGLNFSNKSLLNRLFEYSFTPYYSTKTGKFTGSGSLVYSFMPPESFFRSLDVGISGSYFHYDYNLSYQKYSAFANFSFTKNPRSDIRRNLGFSYNYFQKDLDLEAILENEYDRYNLWNITYGYADNRLIHEKFLGANFQAMEDFQKISAEAFYRYEFAKNKKISFRLFAGYFINNNTRNDIFDYGISRVSNYSFSYGLLGQSATSGILSQQFILADGGFKTFFKDTANQWISSLNVDSHVWKMFNLYADAGVYKNKGLSPEFIWDSGVKVRIVPDFLEVFLPVYSSLGFEPSFKDYGKRIRFTLVLNISALVNTVRRGWY